jgi:hypothetical protein
MNEKLLHYIWQYQLFNKDELYTTDHTLIKISSPGTLNSNQGPDFLNGKIEMGDTIWFGNIELHVVSSDWELHKHSEDVNYNNVILHVVWEHDKELHLEFPTIELKSRVPGLLMKKYQAIMNQQTFIPCEEIINMVKPITISKWKERMLIERLQEKAENTIKLLEKAKGNWDELCWWMLAKNFGGNVNAASFESIASSIPLSIIHKNADSLFTIEALLFGQSGLLNRKFGDEHPVDLFKEYLHLKRKYTLKQPLIQLHFLRMRPANFPTIRLAQLASCIFTERKWLTKIIEEENLDNLKMTFNYDISEYWKTHYRFDTASLYKSKKPGNQTVNNFIINTAVVICFAYGYYHCIEKLKSKAIQWLQELPHEDNSIINGFELLGIDNENAADSQALFHLRSKFCNSKRCLECGIGNEIFRKENQAAITSSCKLSPPVNLDEDFSLPDSYLQFSA